MTESKMTDELMVLVISARNMHLGKQPFVGEFLARFLGGEDFVFLVWKYPQYSASFQRKYPETPPSFVPVYRVS